MRKISTVMTDNRLIVLAAVLVVISTGIALHHVAAVQYTPAEGDLRYLNGTISAERADPGDIRLAKRYPIVSINPEIVNHLPKLKQAFDGADRPRKVETISVNAEEAFAIFGSIRQFDTYEERIVNDTSMNDASFIDKNTTLYKYQWVGLVYGDNWYFISLATTWKLIEDEEVRVKQLLTYTDSFGQHQAVLRAGQMILLNAKIEGDTNGFVHIMQVKNADGIVEQINWRQISEPVTQGLELSYSFIPSQQGEYSIRSFVWKNINGIPLADVGEMTIYVNGGG